MVGCARVCGHHSLALCYKSIQKPKLLRQNSSGRFIPIKLQLSTREYEKSSILDKRE